MRMPEAPQNASGIPAANDLKWMELALTLAREGVGLASPNPTVGCVIVRDNKIVGRGFHQYAQRDHAEVVALAEAGDAARGATAYVTLEPCSHYGRTGPCARALTEAGVARVVAATADPNPLVEGRGFAMLREAGIQSLVRSADRASTRAQRRVRAFHPISQAASLAEDRGDSGRGHRTATATQRNIVRDHRRGIAGTRAGAAPCA